MININSQSSNRLWMLFFPPGRAAFADSAAASAGHSRQDLRPVAREFDLDVSLSVLNQGLLDHEIPIYDHLLPLEDCNVKVSF